MYYRNVVLLKFPILCWILTPIIGSQHINLEPPQMTGHLNRFACQAESKLAEVDRRTQQIQTTLLLLEAKLASIPELEGVKLEEPASKETAVPAEQTVQSATVVPVQHIEEESGEQPAVAPAAAVPAAAAAAAPAEPEPAPGILYSACVS